MTYKELVDRITSNVQAGIKTDETRFSRDFVKAHLNTARATAIQQSFAKYRKINPIWQQEFELVYDADVQLDVNSTCITRYNVPTWIGIDGRTDGMLFVGNSTNRGFRIFNSQSELSLYLNLPLQDPYTGRYVGVVRYADHIELHFSNRVKSGKILMLYQDPLQCPTFNEDLDQYPVTEELIGMIEDLILRKFMSVAQQPIDRVPNKSDSKVAQSTPYRPQ